MDRYPIASLLFVVTLTAAGAFWAGSRYTDPDAALTAPAAALAPAQSAQNALQQPRGAMPPRPQPELKDEEQATISLFERASPSVVNITSIAVARTSAFSMNLREIPRGSGTGFVWDRQGHVVTNYHVMEGANAARVTLSNGSTLEARLVGVAPEKDLAVVKITEPPARLTPLPLGRSQDLRVGQSVFAIGNPFGLDQTLTTGVVSALGREIESPNGVTIRDVVQTDAAINPGNSGGPLLDSSGRLIGVNTALYSPSGVYAGIGFAIPSYAVSHVVPDLIRYGRVQRPTLGIELAPTQAARQLDLEGAIITRVEPGTGADRAGLRGLQQDRYGRIALGDVIQTIDGERIASSSDLLEVLERKRPGQTVRVGILRGERRMEVNVRLGGPGGVEEG
ncbi:MAG TPA: trypsin-like peptidase domain-containing protein [Thermoanaerobaculia bacterium]